MIILLEWTSINKIIHIQRKKDILNQLVISTLYQRSLGLVYWKHQDLKVLEVTCPDKAHLQEDIIPECNGVALHLEGVGEVEERINYIRHFHLLMSMVEE